MEERKTIEAYPLYQISNLGNCKRLFKNWQYKNLKGGKGKTNKDGKHYIVYSLKDDSRERKYLAHRLVAQAFLGYDIKNKLFIICHKDDNPNNNNKDNLFIGTPQDNQTDATNKNRKAKKIDSQTLEKIREDLSIWMTIREIGKAYGVSSTAIHKIKHNLERGTSPIDNQSIAQNTRKDLQKNTFYI